MIIGNDVFYSSFTNNSKHFSIDVSHIICVLFEPLVVSAWLDWENGQTKDTWNVWKYKKSKRQIHLHGCRENQNILKIKSWRLYAFIKVEKPKIEILKMKS